jgi:type II secretory pathway pseudopilin PulG
MGLLYPEGSWLAYMTRFKHIKNERGYALLETIVAVALLGVISLTFLSAVTTTSNSRVIADEHVTARILAESQMENLKEQTYAFSYDPIDIPPEYPGYTAVVDIDTMRNGDIQKITVTIQHRGRDIESLEDYKVNR